MKQKLFTYTTIAILAVTSVSPTLAQQPYYFGPADTGVTWQDITTNAWQKAIPQTAITTITADVISTNLDRRTFTILNEKLVDKAAENVVANAIKEDLFKTTTKELTEKGLEKAAAEKIAEGIVVRGVTSAALKAVTVVGTIETVLEIIWPSDVNWAARGIPLVCVNSTTDKYPNCLAYLITTKGPPVSLWWDVLNPDKQSFAGLVTKWLINVPIGLEQLLGSPNPRCEIWRSGPTMTYLPQAINNQSSETYNLQPGKTKFKFNCFTPGAGLVTEIINTPLNVVSTGFHILGDGLVGVGKSMYSLLPGGPAIGVIPGGNQTPTLTALKEGAYVPPWPIPRDVYHTASVIVAVNTYPDSLTIDLTADKTVVNVGEKVKLNAEGECENPGAPKFYFYCDRKDAGTDITPTLPSLVFDQSAGWIPKVAIEQSTNTCSYDKPGDYIAKVIVEQGGKLTQDRAPIQVIGPRTEVDIKANNQDNPVSISKGSPVTISWRATNTSPTNPTPCVDNLGKKRKAADSFIDTPTSPTNIYTMTCAGVSNSATDKVTVNVSSINIKAR